MSRVQSDESHALKNASLHIPRHGIFHFTMRHVPPPNQHIRFIKHPLP